MGKIFVDTGWEYDGAHEGNLSVGVPGEPISIVGTAGQLHMVDPFKKKMSFDYVAAGGGVGIDLGMPFDLDVTTKDAPSLGVVYSNPVFRDGSNGKEGTGTVISKNDFTGPCLLYQGTATHILGPSVSGTILFFDVGEGVAAGLTAGALTFGAGFAALPALTIGSCSGFVASVGAVAASPQIGASVGIGYIQSAKNQSPGAAELWGTPWKVTIDGSDYCYYFAENGWCFWHEYSSEMKFPEGAGKWKLANDQLYIDWNSDGSEKWSLPLSKTRQLGMWYKGSNVKQLIARKDYFRFSAPKKVEMKTWEIALWP